jgi:glycosyltransferase involved in cell wall biosynthesis
MERVGFDLAVGVRERGEGAMVVALASDGPMGGVLRAAGVPVFSLERRHRGYDLGLMWRLRGLLRSHGVNVVHTHNPLALVYGAVAARLTTCGVVHTKHGKNPGGARQLALRRQAGRFVDAFVAVSAATASVALQKREVHATRLEVIPNGIDLRRFTDSAGARARIRERLGIGMGAWVMGTVGRLAPEKDQATLIRAAAPVLGEQCRLLLVGDGDEASALRAVAAAQPQGRFIHFLGARSDVPELLAAMDVFVLPSITEGLPLVVLEAMAAGRPDVSTPVGGIPEVVQSGLSGRLFAVGDVMGLRALLLDLRADPSGSRRMGEHGRTLVEASYSRDTALDRYVSAYERALAAHV